ncbi:gliding motility-associated C-terminal domain-containing protein [Litoribaculum gwangyangense]|uniref:VWA domain-containing protein n=1 Tax=Litoribaculum gwangyangense TaxID=1130722 RepID=A0ABP9CEU2_9FLAO
MKKDLLYKENYTLQILKFVTVFIFLFSLNNVLGQEIIVNKYAVENSTQCNQFDITLEIIGNPPAQPQEVVLVIDRSGSMDDGPSPTPIEYAQDAAIEFVNNFFLPANNPTGLNKIAIVSFANGATTDLQLTADDGNDANLVNNGRLQAITTINAIATGGPTNTEAGIIAADQVLTNNGTFDCVTNRSIILLSDGVPNRRVGGADCSSTTTVTPCQTEAIQAAIDAQTTIVSGTNYNQSIFTIGLIGAISGTEETIAINTLSQIQNAGAYITENNANLSGIYDDILNQLAPAATQLPGQALVEDIIENGFTLVNGSINASKGTASLVGQTVSWFLDTVRNETVTLNYTIQANANSCGTNPSGTSRINYEDSSCNTTFIDFNNPNICVPCPEINPVISQADCDSIEYSTTFDSGDCGNATSNIFSWEFFLEGVSIGTASSQNGIFNYTGTDPLLGNVTAELTYDGQYGTCTQPSVTETSNILLIEATECDVFVSGCPTPISECSDTDLGSNVTWTPPQFSFACCSAVTGDDFSFYVEFDLPESSNNCWSYNGVQRIGSNNLRLFQSNGNSSFVLAPLQYFDNTNGTPINMELIVPSGVFDWTLEVLDGSNVVYTQTVTGISSSGLRTITIPNTVPNGAYNLNYIFDDNGTGLGANDHIEVDRIYYNATLLDAACTGGINFVVTSTHNPGDFFDANQTTQVTYTATYTPANGDPVILTCDFDVTVDKVDLSESVGAHEDVTCDGDNDGSITVLASGGTPPYTYSLDNVDFSNTTGVFTGLSQGNYNIYVKDDNDCIDPSPLTITIDLLNTQDPTITAPSTIDVEGCNENDITELNSRYPYSNTESADIKDTFIDVANGYNATDDDVSTIASITYIDILTPDTSCPSEVTRTFTITDICGNTATAIQTISIDDITAPIINNSPGDLDVTLECSNLTGIANANTLSPTATDNCSTATINLISDTTTVDPNCPNAYVHVHVWNFTDECGNTSANFTQTITVVDNTPPIINTEASNITVECDGDNSAELIAWLDSNGGANATDNCSSVTWSNDYSGLNLACGATGSGVVTFIATDACGNTNSTSATFTVVDTTPPSINGVPADTSVNCSSVPTAPNVSATDACSTNPLTVTFTETTSPGSCAGNYTVVRTWSATDECGNIANETQTITVVDTTAPVIDNTPGDLDATLECSDAAGISAALTLAPTATDDCSTPAITLVSDDTTVDPTCPNAYTQVRVWNFTDGCNTSANFTQTITVIDTTAPVIDLPANVSAECSDDLSPIAFGTATATDNCDPNPVVTFTDVRTDGPCVGTYTITRTWTATDACGNVASANQIISTSDTTAPTFDQTTLPGNLVVECDGVPEPEVLTATDNCGIALVTVEDVRTNGNCDYNYTITRTYTATDECGLTNTHVQTITVQDTTPPAFVEVLPNANIVVECDAIPNAETLTAIDNCGSATVTVSDTRTDGNCPNSYILSRTWTATDECGLTTTYTQNIIVQDTTAPTFDQTLPRDVTVECDDIPAVTTITASDNCGPATVTVNDVITNGNCPSNYFIARTWVATDECGLTTTHSQIITVQDTTAPVPKTDYEETLDVSCTDIPDAPQLEFEDNCSTNLTVVFNEVNTFNETVFEDYQIIRTWTVRDECNNEAVYTQTLNVTLDEVFSEIVAEDRCFDEGIVNLNDIISGTLNTNGTWELLEGNPDATLNGSIFDPTKLKLSEDFLPDDGGIDYRFRYTTTNEGCISITEVVMNIHADCVVLPCGENDIVISKAITPNGDGYNDTFDIAGIDLCGFVAEVKIFNRWGALVYESDNYTLGSIETSGARGDWDGSSPRSAVGTAGKLPNGTYYYIIKLRNSGLSPLTGPVYLGTK